MTNNNDNYELPRQPATEPDYEPQQQQQHVIIRTSSTHEIGVWCDQGASMEHILMVMQLIAEAEEN